MKKKNFISLLSALLMTAALVPMTAAFADDVAEEEQEIVIGEDVIIANDFDNGKIGKWVPFGGGTLSIDDTLAYSGENSLKIVGRERSYQGPSVITDDLFTPGACYSCDGWVYHSCDTPQTVSWTLKTTDPLGGDSFMQICAAEVQPNEWTHLNGIVTVPEDSKASRIYIECTDETADLNIDSITVVGKKNEDSGGGSNDHEDKYSFDFENDTQGWGSRGDMRVVRTDEISHNGEYSILSSNRSSVWHGPTVSINDYIVKNEEYYYSAFVMYNGEFEDSHVFRMEIQYSLDGADNYKTVCDKELKKGKWTELSGYFTVPAQADNIYLYIQTDNLDEGNKPGTNDLMPFYVDDVSITKGEIMRAYTRRKNIIIVTVSVAIAAVILFAIYTMVKRTIRTNAAIKLANVDAMTKMQNRNAYEKRVAEMEADPALCRGLNFALCDVNFLKYINDNYGHEQGDDAIIRCAKMLKRVVGSNGEVYRIGGDEFVCIAKVPIKDEIKAAAEYEKYKGYPFAVACGCAEYSEPDLADIKSIIAKCDKLMYEDKKRIKAENKEFSRK